MRPGWGKGDKKHDHSGPPGQQKEKKTGPPGQQQKEKKAKKK
jgi:hypothetical protein